MGRNIFLVRHLGAGGIVYSWPGKVSYLTAGIEKEVQVFWDSLFGLSTPGMAVGSTHQCGMSNWQACQSSHTSMFLIEGSGGNPPTSNVWVGYGHLLGMYCFLPSGKLGNPITIFQVYSIRTSLGSSMGPFPWVWLYLWFLEGYSPLCSMPAQGPQMSIQRLTPWAATAANVGSGVLGIPYPLT